MFREFSRSGLLPRYLDGATGLGLTHCFSMRGMIITTVIISIILSTLQISYKAFCGPQRKKSEVVVHGARYVSEDVARHYGAGCIRFYTFDLLVFLTLSFFPIVLCI